MSSSVSRLQASRALASARAQAPEAPSLCCRALTADTPQERRSERARPVQFSVLERASLPLVSGLFVVPRTTRQTRARSFQAVSRHLRRARKRQRPRRRRRTRRKAQRNSTARRSPHCTGLAATAQRRAVERARGWRRNKRETGARVGGATLPREHRQTEPNAAYRARAKPSAQLRQRTPSWRSQPDRDGSLDARRRTSPGRRTPDAQVDLNALVRERYYAHICTQMLASNASAMVFVLCVTCSAPVWRASRRADSRLARFGAGAWR